MTSNAGALVAGAKEWASRYGDFANGEEGAALTAVLRVQAAWEANDAAALAAMFLGNGSLLLGDAQFTDPEGIRGYLAEAFAGGWKGSKLVASPVEVRVLGAGVALAVTEGGIARPGAESVERADAARLMWVLARRDGDWRVQSLQSSPVGG